MPFDRNLLEPIKSGFDPALLEPLTDEDAGEVVLPGELREPEQLSDAAAMMKEGAADSLHATRRAQVADAFAKGLDIPGLFKTLVNQPNRIAGLPDMPPIITPETGTKVAKFFSPVSSSEGSLSQGVESGVGQLLSGLTEPENLAAMVLAKRFPMPVARAFQGEMIGGIPEATGQLLAAKTPAEAGRAGVGLLADTALPAGIEKGINASKIKEAATVHGDLQSQPIEGAGEVPAKEGSAGILNEAEAGLLPNREALTPANRFEATTPHENLASKMASQVGKTVEFTDDLPQGVIAVPGPKDTIRIDRAELAKWMEGRSPEEAPLLIESLIDEEEIHSHTPNEVGLEYHDAKTPLQRKLALRRYAGKGGPEVSPTNLGKEMLRFDMQRLMGKSPREILEAKGSEWLTVKFITAAEQVIDGARKALGTEASQNQARILDQMEQKVGLARQALGMGPRTQEADTSDEGELAPATEDAPFALNKDAAKGEVKRITELPDEEMVKFAQGTKGFQGEAARAGLPFSASDVPELEKLRDEFHQKGMASLMSDMEKGGHATSPATIANQSKVIWLNGVIEGAKKKGGNYEAIAEEQPAARRKPTKDDRQQEMPLPSGVKGETPPERPSAEDLGATTEAVTPSKLEALTQEHLLGSQTRPSFTAFVTEVKQRFGNVQPGQLKEAWRDAVWKRLMSAKGNELARLRDQLGLKEGIAENIPDEISAGAPEEAQAAAARDALLAKSRRMELKAQEAERQAQTKRRGAQNADPMAKLDAEAAATSAEALARQLRAQSDQIATQARNAAPEALPKTAAVKAPAHRGVRENAIARIGEKLIKQSEAERPSLRRSSVTPEDIGWWRETGGIEPPFTEFKRGEKVTPEKLTSGSTIDTARKLPASASTRLVALHDNLSGKTELVSAYKDHGKHYIVDPGNPGAARPHVLINDLLQRKLSNGKPRYSPVASLLLDEPVQRFHQRMDSNAWQEFTDAAGNEAQARKESAVEAAALPQPETEEARPALRTGTAITDAEAGAILDHLHDEVGKLDSPEDMRDALTALQERASNGTLQGRDWQVISGLEKAVEKIQKQFRNVGPNEAYEKALDQIYSHATEAPSREAFVQRMLGKPAADVAGGIPGGPEATSTEPASYRKGANIGAEFAKAGSGIRALWRRSPINVNIAAHLDSFINRGNNTARKAGNSIRLQSSDPKARTSLERGAAIRVLEARGDKEALLGFAQNVGLALQRARALAQDGKTVMDRYEGRKWEKAATRMQEEIQYAYDNWQKRSLRQTAAKGKAVLDEVYEFDKNRGVKLDYRGGYIPGRYEGEIFNDNVLTFGDQQLILGRNWRKAKAFSNYSEALKEGYIPINNDLADLAEHRVRQSWREGGKDLWLDSLKQWNDPDSGEPIVEPLAKQEVPRPMKKVTDDQGQTAMVESAPKVEWGTPSAEYVKFSLGPGKDVVAVRRGYEKLLQTLTMQGHISMHPVGDVALHLTGALKHGVILILDTFHPGRLGQYAVGISNKPGYRKGFHVLEYAEEDMQQAADKGLIPQSSVDWAKGTIEVRLPGGRTAPMTRRAVIDFGESLGLNTGRIQDALYKETVRRWPLIGALNRFTFDRLTRGLMAEGTVSEFERLNKAYPALDRNAVMTKVVRDINRYYGNLGNQGVFRNPTIKEINQLIFLAPQWVEGLLQKELRGVARAVTGPYDMVRNQFVEDAEKRIPFGTIGRGMGRGLAAYFALTQAINLITRRQSTFQNTEPDHKLDAWIPGGKNGFFISPLSVFAEVAHDILRYAEQKPMLNEALTQIGYNKLGPWGRLAVVLGTERNGQGEKLTSTPSVYKEAAMQVVPFAGASPISVSKLARAAGHAVAPSLVAPNQPGAVQRQLMSSAGIKVEPAKAPPASIADKARRFAEAQHWKKMEFPDRTEDPSYSKVRQAIRIGDEKGAMKVIAELRKEKSDAQIEKAMRQHISRPFTGSKEHEREFMDSLSAADASLYDAARDEQAQELEKFLTLWDRRP